MPTQITILIFTLLNIVLTLHDLRQGRMSHGVGIPILVWHFSTLVFYVVCIRDCAMGGNLLDDQTYMVWNLTTRLQGAIAFFGLLSHRISVEKIVADEVEKIVHERDVTDGRPAR